MRTVATLAVLGLLLLAGCASKPSSSADTPVAPVTSSSAMDDGKRLVAQAPTFLAPVELGSMTLGAEPSVAIAPDGTVYVTTPLALWRSDDQGVTFKPLGTPGCAQGLPVCPPGFEEYDPGLVGGGDASLLITPDGVAHWAGLGGGIPYQRSTDKGETWSDDIDVSNGTGSDREWVAVDRETGLLTVQWRGSDDDGTGIFYAASSDSGLSWGPIERVAADGRQGPIAHDPSSSAMLLAHQLDGLLYVARNVNGTWEDVPVAPVNGRPYIFPIVAFDDAGTAYMTYAADLEALSAVDLAVEVSRMVARPHVYLQTSHDKGLTWSAPIQLSPPDVPAFFPWIDAGAPGRVVVAWYEAQQPVPANRLPNVFDVKVALSGDADQAKPTYAIGQANTAPVHIGAFCTEGAACTLTGGDRSMLDFFEVRVHPDGGAVLAWAADDEVKQARIKVFAAKMTGGLDLLH